MTNIYHRLVFAFVSLSLLGAGGTDTRVVTAAKNRDAGRVKALIAEHADVNAPDLDGASAILWAAHWGDVELAKLLVAAKADVNAPNHFGVTPLYDASARGDAALVTVLLNAGADAKRSIQQGDTPLHAAARTNSVDTVRALLRAGAAVDAVETWQGQTPLMVAAAYGNDDVVTALVKAGADVNVVAKPNPLPMRPRGTDFYADHSTGGFTALMFASRFNKPAMTKALVDAHAELNVSTPEGATALMIAVMNGSLDTAAVLVESGAKTNDGSLYQLEEFRNISVDENIDDASRPRVPPKTTVDSLALVKLLLEHGADPNVPFMLRLHMGGRAMPGVPGATAFYRAAKSGDVEAMRLMIAKGASARVATEDESNPGGPYAQPPSKKTPLMAAIEREQGLPGAAGGRAAGRQYRFEVPRDPMEAFKLCLDAGADVDAVDRDGNAAVHLAAQRGNDDMIRLLAKAGAKLDLQNKASLTPLDLALGKQPANGGRGAGGGAAGRGGAPVVRESTAALLRELLGLPAVSAEKPTATPKPAGENQ